jgi:hypothetical protein
MKTNLGPTLKTILGACTVLTVLALTAGPITAATNSSRSNSATDLPAIREPANTRVETAILADDRPEVFARARTVREALGIPGGARNQGLHVKDGQRKLEYNEITESDASGQPVSVTQLDGSGRLLLAVRLDQPKTTRSPTGREAALKKASEGLAAAGIRPAGSASIEASEGSGGWDAYWTRTSNGVPVRGDELRVHVRDDGAIGSVGQVTHELAEAPAYRLSKDQALSVASGQMRTWSSRSGASFSVRDLDLEWAGPNAAFEPSRIDAPEAPYRLAWIVNVIPTGDAASYARLVTLYIDAGDGSVVGGDVVE